MSRPGSALPGSAIVATFSGAGASTFLSWITIGARPPCSSPMVDRMGVADLAGVTPAMLLYCEY